MADIPPVNWHDLLNVYKTCLFGRLCNFDGYASQTNQLKIDSGIAEAEAIANPIAYVVEKITSRSSSGTDSHNQVAQNGKFQLQHPISGEVQGVNSVQINKEEIENSISQLTENFNDPRSKFLSLWRFLPEKVEEKFPGIPTSLVAPDNLLINHVDMTTGIWASRQNGSGGCAYLSFAMGPVQPFIEEARSVRDLWTGSAILSWLAFQSMKPILENYGPTAFVYPSLRKNPLMDLWLHKGVKLDQLSSPDTKYKRCPTIPHRFVALVPWGDNGEIASALAKQCEIEGRDAWARISNEVREKLDPRFVEFYKDWSRLWNNQIENVFDFQTCVVPESKLTDELLAKMASSEGNFESVWPELEKIKNFFRKISAETESAEEKQEIADTIDEIGRWKTHMGYSASVMEAIRSIRQIPTVEVTADSDGFAPPKCSVYGTWEQMGPAKLSESAKFWDQVAKSFEDNDVNGVRIRKSEQFCAISLTKRFAAPVMLSNEFDLKTGDLRFPDTATVAAADWLKEVKIDPEDERAKTPKGWSGRWLHNPKDEQDGHAPKELRDKIFAGKKKEGKPPAYYAILLMDGDKLGDQLSGEVAPSLAKTLPADLKSKLEQEENSEQNSDAKLKKTVSPNLHSSISSALSNFASYLAPEIVDRYNGTVIYSGGDDLLALLPASKAVECAAKLRAAYRSGALDSESDKKNGMGGMGNKAGITAAIVIAHHMEDLRTALKSARDTEKDAKNSGRDILNLKIMRRSGGHSSALLPWSEVEWFNELSNLFDKNASNRWSYKLYSEAMLDWVDDEFDGTIKTEIKRVGNRIEDDVWKDFVKKQNSNNSSENSLSTGEIIANWWGSYHQAFAKRKNEADEKTRIKIEDKVSAKSLFKSFALLCQSAAFVVRAYDDKD